MLQNTTRFCSLALVGIGLGGCTISTPFSGPGVNEPETKTVVVALTHAVLNPKKRDAFDEHTELVVDALPSFKGFVGYSVRKELFGHEAWTMTVWTDEESLADFVDSDVHTRAIEAGMPATVSARFHRFEMKATAVPVNWDEALTLLDERGSDHGYGR